MLLKDLAVGSTISDVVVLVNSAEQKKTKNGKAYIVARMQEKALIIPTNFWNMTKETAINKGIGTGKMIKILSGKVSSYNGSKQLEITDFSPVSDEDFDRNLLEQSSPVSKNDMAEFVNSQIEKMQNPVWKNIVNTLIDKVSDYYDAPAAKMMHHAFKSGLAFHSTTMAKGAIALSGIYPQLNKELMVATALIHDMGKTLEIENDDTRDYTFEGKLIGHISILDGWLTDIISSYEKGTDEYQDAVLLRHMVLSHHGLLEYGSPVMPKILEAEVLHTLDALDAKVEMISEALDTVDTNEWTEKVFGADNRSFYKFHN